MTTNFEYSKIYHVEFDVSSKKLLILYEFKMGSHIRIVDFESVKKVIEKKKGAEDKSVPSSEIKTLYNFPILTQDG